MLQGRYYNIDLSELWKMWDGGVPTRDIAAHFGVKTSTIYLIQKTYDLPDRGRICKPKDVDPTPEEIAQRAAECRARRPEVIERHARVEIRQYVMNDSRGTIDARDFVW
jgi:transposase